MKRKLIYLLIPIFVFILLFTLAATCSSSGSKSETSTETSEAVPESSDTSQKQIKIEKTYYDIPSLIDKDAFEIKEILESSIGEPETFTEPSGEFFGTLGWTIMIEGTKNSLMFGYDYYEDGKIDENILVLTGIIEENEPLFTIEDVIRSGNLDVSSTDYKVDIHRDDENIKEVWVIFK